MSEGVELKLGDRVQRRHRRQRVERQFDADHYRLETDRCPDCDSLFISLRATLIPGAATGPNARSYPPKRAARCNECRAVHEAKLKAERGRRYRAKRATPKPAVTCPHCGEAFTPQRSTAVYCSGKCRVAASRARTADLPSVSGNEFAAALLARQ